MSIFAGLRTARARAPFACVALLATLGTAPLSAHELNTAAGGTFTFSFDRDALAPYVLGAAFGNNGYYLAEFWDAAASDPGNPANTDLNLAASIGAAEIPAGSLVHNLTPVGADPAAQVSGRHVVGTTAGFFLDGDTLDGAPIVSMSLAGVVGEKLGMTGVHGFNAPNFPGTLVNGDFSLQYDPSRLSNSRSGWFIANNMSFTMAVYDLANLALTWSEDEEANWLLTGDLWMSPENADMLLGASLADVGDFRLGVGSYAAPVPLPAAVWSLGCALLGLCGAARRPRRGQVISHG